MFVLLCAICFTIPAMTADPTIDDLSWLAGTWAAEDKGFEEHWLPPRNGAMPMIGRGDSGFMEFGAIETGADGKLTLWMMPGAPSHGRKEPAAFPLKSLEGRHVVFERGGDDFPQRIIYRLDVDDLRVRLEGDRPALEFVLRRT